MSSSGSTRRITRSPACSDDRRREVDAPFLEPRAASREPMPLDDHLLDRTVTPASREQPRTPTPLWRWILVVGGAMAAGAVLMFWWMSRAQPVPPTPASTTA